MSTKGLLFQSHAREYLVVDVDGDYASCNGRVEAAHKGYILRYPLCGQLVAEGLSALCIDVELTIV